MPDTALPPTIVVADPPIAVTPGEAPTSFPGAVDLTRVRAQMREGKVPDLSAPAPPVTTEPPAPVTAEPAAPAPPTTPDDGEPVPASPKNRRVSQEYLNDLVAARARAELRAEQMEERLRALESPREPAAPAPTRPMPTEDQVGMQYQTYGEYVADLTKWQIEQVEATRTRADLDAHAEQSNRQALEAYQSRIPAAKARHADFDTVIAQTLPAPLTPTLRSALVASEIGPDLAYHLTTHPEEYLRLRRLPVGLALMAVGRLEAQLQASWTAPAAAPPNPAPLPAPMAPVGGHATTGTPDLSGPTIDLRVFRAAVKPRFGMRG